ncbi:hypothetical protein SAMN05443253_1249 [Bacillus sp. OK048]|nr:hypothetical protein SAMN05443253_1249 [Bacillus sp. OK048]
MDEKEENKLNRLSKTIRSMGYFKWDTKNINQ